MSNINSQQTLFVELQTQLDTNWPDGTSAYAKDTDSFWVLDNGVFVSIGGDITRVQNGINTFTAGTVNYPSVNITAATLNNLTVTGLTALNTMSAVTVSATTLYSGSTNLNTIITQIVTGSSSNVSIANGINTYTGGTASLPTINVTAATLNNLSVSANTILAPTTATTLSVLNSGATATIWRDASGNLINTGVTFASIIGGTGSTINRDLSNVNIIGGYRISGTNDNHTYTSNLVVTGTSNGNLYATNLYSGSTNLYSIFATTAGATGFTPETIYVAISDETTQITTGTNKVTLYAPYAFNLTDVKASLSQSGSTTITTFNVKLTGTTIFSTKPTIDINEFSTSTAATPRVITATTIPVDSKITVDVDTIGTGCAGAKIYLMGYRI
jgi:hypothetical protein